MGGGSTANLLALWRLHGLDTILRECWEAGVVLKGVSAGSLCWHVGGTTDSFGPDLQPVTNGLAFLPYSNSPHHDAEEQRRPLIHRLIAEGTLPDGYATENGTGLVFFGTELQEAFTEEEGKVAYSLTRAGESRPGEAAPDPPAPLIGGQVRQGPGRAGVHRVGVAARAQNPAPARAVVKEPWRTTSVPFTSTCRMPVASA